MNGANAQNETSVMLRCPLCITQFTSTQVAELCSASDAKKKKKYPINLISLNKRLDASAVDG